MLADADVCIRLDGERSGDVLGNRIVVSAVDHEVIDVNGSFKSSVDGSSAVSGEDERAEVTVSDRDIAVSNGVLGRIHDGGVDECRAVVQDDHSGVADVDRLDRGFAVDVDRSAVGERSVNVEDGVCDRHCSGVVRVSVDLDGGVVVETDDRLFRIACRQTARDEDRIVHRESRSLLAVHFVAVPHLEPGAGVHDRVVQHEIAALDGSVTEFDLRVVFVERAVAVDRQFGIPAHDEVFRGGREASGFGNRHFGLGADVEQVGVDLAVDVQLGSPCGLITDVEGAAPAALRNVQGDVFTDGEGVIQTVLADEVELAVGIRCVGGVADDVPGDRDGRFSREDEVALEVEQRSVDVFREVGFDRDGPGRFLDGASGFIKRGERVESVEVTGLAFDRIAEFIFGIGRVDEVVFRIGLADVERVVKDRVTDVLDFAPVGDDGCVVDRIGSGVFHDLVDAVRVTGDVDGDGAVRRGESAEGQTRGVVHCNRRIREDGDGSRRGELGVVREGQAAFVEGVDARGLCEVTKLDVAVDGNRRIVFHREVGCGIGAAVLDVADEIEFGFITPDGDVASCGACRRGVSERGFRAVHEGEFAGIRNVEVQRLERCVKDIEHAFSVEVGEGCACFVLNGQHAVGSQIEIAAGSAAVELGSCTGDEDPVSSIALIFGCGTDVGASADRQFRTAGDGDGCGGEVRAEADSQILVPAGADVCAVGKKGCSEHEDFRTDALIRVARGGVDDRIRSEHCILDGDESGSGRGEFRRDRGVFVDGEVIVVGNGHRLQGGFVDHEFAVVGDVADFRCGVVEEFQLSAIVDYNGVAEFAAVGHADLCGSCPPEVGTVGQRNRCSLLDEEVVVLGAVAPAGLAQRGVVEAERRQSVRAVGFDCAGIDHGVGHVDGRSVRITDGVEVVAGEDGGIFD